MKSPTTELHPVTGVELNVIPVRRPSLGPDDAVTIFLMVDEGYDKHIIAAMLGTNIARVYEVLNGENHPDAFARACELAPPGPLI